MSIREINYEITASGIEPAAVQSGGVQGDHNATVLTFGFAESFTRVLEAAVSDSGGRILYRFDTVDAAGNTDRSDPQVLGNQTQVAFPVTRELSMFGGNARVYLCLTLEKEEESQADIFTFPARLYFEPRPGAEYEETERQALSTLARIARESAASALESRESAAQDREATELAAVNLTENTQLIFNGGNSSTELPVSIVVDNALSTVSTNPVQNRLITSRINTLEANLTDEINALVESAIDQAVVAAKANMYPVGSIYLSLDSTDPHELFGGTWERIKERFLLGCSDATDETEDKHLAEATGGDATVTLTVAQMPIHQHELRHRTQAGNLYGTVTTSGNTTSMSGGVYTKDCGGGQPHNNMPPYLAVYMWKRTA